MQLYTFFIYTFLILAITPLQSQTNYDEGKVPYYEVPDVMATNDGKKVKSIAAWENLRRPEVLQFFETEVYGMVPENLEINSYTIVEEEANALNGKAIRKQVEITLKNNDKILPFTLLLYLPKKNTKAPIFLGYNFYGNHTITEDKDVLVSKAWTRNNEAFNIKNHTLTEASRGVRKNRWPIAKIVDAGYGLAVMYYGELDGDKNDMTDGLHALFYPGDDQQEPKSNPWGSITAWAFGLSKAMDYLVQDNDVGKVIVFGHSRLGKTSLWAGAQDQRFAGVISNNSGCGGAALSKRRFGETIKVVNANFPHWFADNFNNFNDQEAALPMDQHGLLSLIAPRPLYVASAEDDLWADPYGEYLAAHYATPVYELYNKKGLKKQKMPKTDTPVNRTVGYHVRTGKHDVTDYDWEQFITWANKQIQP